MALTEPTESRYMTALRQAWPWAVERFALYMTSPRYWMVVLTACLLAGVAGPFGMHQLLNTPQRILYWTLLLVPTIPFVLGLSLVLREAARILAIRWGWAALASGLLSILPVSLYSALVDTPFLAAEDQLSLSYILSSTALPLVVLTVVVNAFFPTLQPLWAGAETRSRDSLPPRHRDFGTMFDDPAPAVPDVARSGLPRQALEASPLFERLPEALGQDIICIRADNHHIEVTTPLGVARVLMRLGDAEADLAPFPGLRVHRSWWVNLAHVTAIGGDTGNGGMDLVLSTGARAPVSRGQRSAVNAALRRHGWPTRMG